MNVIFMLWSGWLEFSAETWSNEIHYSTVHVIHFVTFVYPLLILSDLYVGYSWFYCLQAEVLIRTVQLFHLNCVYSQVSNNEHGMLRPLSCQDFSLQKKMSTTYKKTRKTCRKQACRVLADWFKHVLCWATFLYIGYSEIRFFFFNCCWCNNTITTL